MKKPYSKPVFKAEKYQVTNSIALCQYRVGDPDDHESLDIVTGQKYCYVGDNGHLYEKSPLYEELGRNTTVFNDGSANTSGCECDWAGKTFTSPYGKEYSSFGAAVYGATANNTNHVPAYKGQTFFS